MYVCSLNHFTIRSIDRSIVRHSIWKEWLVFLQIDQICYSFSSSAVPYRNIMFQTMVFTSSSSSSSSFQGNDLLFIDLFNVCLYLIDRAMWFKANDVKKQQQRTKLIKIYTRLMWTNRIWLYWMDGRLNIIILNPTTNLYYSMHTHEIERNTVIIPIYRMFLLNIWIVSLAIFGEIQVSGPTDFLAKFYFRKKENEKKVRIHMTVFANLFKTFTEFLSMYANELISSSYFIHLHIVVCVFV